MTTSISNAIAPARARTPGARILGAALLPLLLLLGVQGAWAGVFSVTPVRVYMTPKDRAVAITLNNDGDTPIVLQADIYKWDQRENGEDEMVLTEDLLLAPPIIRLAPGAHQVVRLAMLRPRDPYWQMTYRMILREVPEAAPPSNRIAVPVALALNMPVFITPSGAKRDVKCGINMDDEKSVTVFCKNAGTAYAQIRELTVKRDGKELARFEGGTYILPGAGKYIKLKADKRHAAGNATLTLMFDDFQGQTSVSYLP
jgi:fimbrial chaperone protein